MIDAFDGTPSIKVAIAAAELLPYRSVDARILLFGLERSWLSEREVVEWCLERYRAGASIGVGFEGIALLLPDEFDRVEHLLETIGGDSELAREFWLFFLHARLLNNYPDDKRLWVMQEEVHCAFGHPESTDSFTSYGNQASGPAKFNKRRSIWHDRGRRAQLDALRYFVETEAKRFGHEA